MIAPIKKNEHAKDPQHGCFMPENTRLDDAKEVYGLRITYIFF